MKFSWLKSPCCQAKLAQKKNRLVCVQCQKKYFFKKEKPVLITLERKKENQKWLNRADLYSHPIEKIPGIKKLFPPSESLRLVNKESQLISQLSPKAKALVIGEEKKERVNNQIVYMDIDPDMQVDLVADANQLPFKNASFELVICRYVLEHLTEPDRVVKEIKRVLKREGLVYIDVPFLQPYHPSPADYQRFSLQGLRWLMRDFKELETGISQGPASALAWVLVKFPGIFFNSHFLYRLSIFVANWLVWPLKYLDLFLVKKKFAFTLASSFFFIGKKR